MEGAEGGRARRLERDRRTDWRAGACVIEEALTSQLAGSLARSLSEREIEPSAVAAWPAASPTSTPLLLPHPSSGQPTVVKNRDSDGVTLASEYAVYFIAQEWSECEVSDAYQKGVIVIRLIAATAPLDGEGGEREGILHIEDKCTHATESREREESEERSKWTPEQVEGEAIRYVLIAPFRAPLFAALQSC